jgi:hypothetical protein
MKLLVALAVAGALALGASAAQAKDDLIIGVAQFPSSLHPDIDAEVIKGYVNAFTIRQITAYDKDWKNSCLLCTELPSLDNGLAKREKQPDGTDGLAVTLKLKPDLKWGDGVPVTAKDIEFTWRVGKDPSSGFSNTNPWSRATSVDVVDDHTAVMHLSKVTVDYAQWDNIIPEHIEGPIYAAAKAPGDYLNHTAFNRDPTNPGLADGPYRITDYKSGSQIVMEPNPSWSGTKPGFKHIVIRLIENTAALQANLLSGDVDMVNGEGVGLTIDQVLGMRKQYPDRFVYIFKPSLTYEHININRDNPILADLKVRRALLLSLDRQTLVNKLFEGMQPVAATWVNPLDSNYDKSIKPLPYAAGRGRLDTRRRRHLPQRKGRSPGAGDRHHRRQPHPRTDRAGAAKPVEGVVHRRVDQERAAAHLLRRDGQAPRLHHGDVRLEQQRERQPVPHAAQQPDPHGGEQLGRLQRLGLQRPEDGRRHHGRPRRARPGEAEGTVGRHAADLFRPAARAAAVLPVRGACDPEMAERLRTDRHQRLRRHVVRELAQRVA